MEEKKESDAQRVAVREEQKDGSRHEEASEFQKYCLLFSDRLKAPKSAAVVSAIEQYPPTPPGSFVNTEIKKEQSREQQSELVAAFLSRVSKQFKEAWCIVRWAPNR